MGRTETIVRSDRHRRALPADRAGAALAVERPVIAGPTPVTVAPICLVTGLAAALLSSDLAWSHRAAVAATVGFGLAIALWHARPDRTNWWLTGAFAVVVAVVGSRVDLLRGADPAWILWAAALAVAVASARPPNASTGGGDAPDVMMTTVAVLAATTVACAAWWYIGGTSPVVAVTIGAVPVAAVLFVGVRASSTASPRSMMLIAVASGLLGTALALLDTAPHIGQAAIAAVITGLVGVTMSTAGSPFLNRLVEMLLLASLVTAAGGSTWAVVVALAIGAVAVLCIGSHPHTVAAGSRTVTDRSTGPGDPAFVLDLSAAADEVAAVSPIDELAPLEDPAAKRSETLTAAPLPTIRPPLGRTALRQEWSPCSDPVGPSDGSRTRRAPAPESAAFTFDLWSALGVDHSGSSKPDRATQAAFAQRSDTSVFDEPEAIRRSSS